MLIMYMYRCSPCSVARDTTVAKIMTKGPMCVTSDTAATEALNLMVSRGFRHLVSLSAVLVQTTDSTHFLFV